MVKRDRRKGGAAARRWLLKDAAAHSASRHFAYPEPLEERLALHAEAVIAEVMYQPPGPTDTELSRVPGVGSDNFEFLEVLNPSASEVLALRDIQVAGDVQLTLPDEQLGPGESVVVAADPIAFAARYGNGHRVVGPWQGTLADGPVQIRLIDSDGHSVVDLQLGGSTLWPFLADGLGSSLELLDPAATLPSQMSKPGRWQASFEYLGTPGALRSATSGVVINEVFAGFDSSRGLTDQVELRNTGAAAVDISGWYLGNSPSSPLQYQLPANTILAAGEFRVLDARDFNPTPNSPGPLDFQLDVVHGDQLFLSTADGSGQVTRFEDSVRWGPGGGTSWGRDPAQAGLFTVLGAATLGAGNAAAAFGPAVISELNFHPGAPSPEALQLDAALTADDLEYVELYNPTPNSLDLSAWSLGGVVDWTFAAGTVLAAEEALVVVGFDPQQPELSARLQAFRQQYGLDPAARLVGPYLGHQPNDYGHVTLLQPAASPADEPEFTPLQLRDEARYDDLPPWPNETDGNGFALHRFAVDASGLTAGGWTAQQPTPGQVSFTPPPQPLLPDLKIWDDPLLGLNYFTSLDVHPRTGRQIMRFSTAVQNAGQGPLTVQGGEVVGSRQQVVQVVQHDDGSTTEYAAGEYVFHPTHGHVHFANYAFYRLYEVAPDGGLGAQVAGGEKVSFCLIDSSPFDVNLPGAPHLPVYAQCERRTQGISVGWADVYTSDLDDQWIEVEDLPPGEYWFETIVDPYDNLIEADESNNVIRHKIVLGVAQYAPDALDVAGINEQRLGVGDKQLSPLSIHKPGDVDTFRWVAARDGTLDVDLQFDRTQGDIDLYVWGTDAAGKVELLMSTTEGNDEHVTMSVRSGKSYLIVVKELSGDTNPAYSLMVDGPDILPDDLEPNDRILEPVDLGQANQTLKDLTIHSPTDQDFFAWTASATATLLVDLQFNSIQGNLDLFVHDFDNNLVATSQSNIGRELLEVSVEQGRTYLIIVEGRNGDMVNHYDLTVDLLNIPLDRFEPNDAYTSPVNLGAGDRNLDDLTIHKPYNRDFYRWQAPADGTAVADLLFAQAEGDLDLLLWEGGESVAISNSSTDNEQLTFAVTGGHTYLLEVVGKNGATSPHYGLTVDGPAPAPDAYEPNDSLATATNLGQGDVESVVANIHESFNSDFFLWTPAANGVAIIDLLFQHIEGDLDLVLWANGTQVEVAESSDDNERVFRYIDADQTYVLEVRGKDGDINPHYELRIDGPELVADALEPNDNLADAVDLGSGDVQLTGLNIHQADNSDFYLWSPRAAGQATIELLFLQAGGDLDLAWWVDGIETLLSDSIDDGEQLSPDVVFGQQYVIDVRGKQGAVNPFYELQVKGPAAPQITGFQVAKASAPGRWYAPLAGDGSMASVPWLDWRQIQIEFSQDVRVRGEDLQVEDSAAAELPLQDFVYDATRHTATWTFVTGPAAGPLVLTLSDAITDASLNALDGDGGPLLPSGDGLPGGAWVLPVNVLPGDFHADGMLDGLDIDALAAAIQAGDPVFDLNDDGQSTSSDIVVWVQDLMGTAIGDVNLDGRFDSTDLVIVFIAGEFEDSRVGHSTWATGDLNGDGEFDSSDLVFAFEFGGYQA